jgi:hypothetical protein
LLPIVALERNGHDRIGDERGYEPYDQLGLTAFEALVDATDGDGAKPDVTDKTIAWVALLQGHHAAKGEKEKHERDVQ